MTHSKHGELKCCNALLKVNETFKKHYYNRDKDMYIQETETRTAVLLLGTSAGGSGYKQMAS